MPRTRAAAMMARGYQIKALVGRWASNSLFAAGPISQAKAAVDPATVRAHSPAKTIRQRNGAR